jgi:RNA polymerase-binding transcription factor DksA
MQCIKCSKPIPAERLAALPETVVCLGCSNAQPTQAPQSFAPRTPEHKDRHARAGRAYSTEWWAR